MQIRLVREEGSDHLFHFEGIPINLWGKTSHLLQIGIELSPLCDHKRGEEGEGFQINTG